MIFFFAAINIFYLTFLTFVLLGLKKVRKNIQLNSVKREDYFVSVILPFRNEEKVLRNTLLNILNQNYSSNKFEVILVNDNSTDNSVESIKDKVDGEKVKLINSFHNGKTAYKKYAISEAIKIAKGEIIVTTDADCIHKPTWLKTLINNLNGEISFIVGPVKFESGNLFFDKFQELEFSGLQHTAAGLIGINKPIICSAANIAYRKSEFEKVGGFSGSMHLASGDDEMLMQKIHQRGGKVIFCWNEDALVLTQKNGTIQEFMNQRIRWASKGIFYNSLKIKLMLIIIYFYFISFPLALILSFISIQYFFVFIISFALKVIFEFFILKNGERFLHNKMSIINLLLSQVIHIPYILSMGILGLIGNFKWKGRELAR